MDRDILANLMKRFPMKKLPNGNIRTCPVRLSFTYLAEPREPENPKAKPKYSALLLFPKGADISVLVEDCKAAAVEAHGAEALKLVQAGKIKWPIKDQGKMTREDGELWDGCEDGAKAVEAKTERRPGTVDAQAQACDPAKLYSGCWALVTIHTFAGSHEKGGKYVSIGLNNLQFLADDERFGGGAQVTDPSEEFAPIDGTADTSALFNGSGADKGAGKEASDFDFG